MANPKFARYITHLRLAKIIKNESKLLEAFSVQHTCLRYTKYLLREQPQICPITPCDGPMK